MGTLRQPGRTLVIGVDIGQKRDPTALAVAEVQLRQGDQGKSETHFLVRFLGRLPLGTPYPEVARRTAEIVNRSRDQISGIPSVFLYVDATGVGQPVVDLIAERRLRANLLPVYFTHGDRRMQDSEKVILGKAYLVSRLQLLLQCRRVHAPASAEAQALARELEEYEIRVTENANDRYGAFRVGTHDDLVTALGLAVQTDRPKPLRVVHVAVWAARPPGL